MVRARGCLKEPGAEGLLDLAADGLTEPERARASRVEGRVVLQAVVRADGRVGEACVMDSRPEGLGYEEASLAALERWRYEPATRDGSPVDRAVTVVFNFEYR